MPLAGCSRLGEAAWNYFKTLSHERWATHQTVNKVCKDAQTGAVCQGRAGFRVNVLSMTGLFEQRSLQIVFIALQQPIRR